MPRISRGIVPGYAYHIINRGNARQCIFHNHYDYRNFLTLMKEAKRRYPVKLISFCLMPNHFHFVMIPEQCKSLSKFMQWLLTSHVRRSHKAYKTDGHIWQGRFRSFVIQNDHHLLTVMRYVEANPKRAKLVDRAENWHWSSLPYRTGNNDSRLLDDSPVPLPENWDNMVNSDLSGKELEPIRASVIRQSPLGDKTWRDRIIEELGIQSTVRPRGRPPKKGTG